MESDAIQELLQTIELDDELLPQLSRLVDRTFGAFEGFAADLLSFALAAKESAAITEARP